MNERHEFFFIFFADWPPFKLNLQRIPRFLGNLHLAGYCWWRARGAQTVSQHVTSPYTEWHPMTTGGSISVEQKSSHLSDCSLIPSCFSPEVAGCFCRWLWSLTGLLGDDPICLFEHLPCGPRQREGWLRGTCLWDVLIVWCVSLKVHSTPSSRQSGCRIPNLAFLERHWCTSQTNTASKTSWSIAFNGCRITSQFHASEIEKIFSSTVFGSKLFWGWSFLPLAHRTDVPWAFWPTSVKTSELKMNALIFQQKRIEVTWDSKIFNYFQICMCHYDIWSICSIRGTFKLLNLPISAPVGCRTVATWGG